MNLRLILRIARTELASLFYSPVAWLLLVAFSVQVGIDFLNILRQIVMIKAMGSTVTFSVTAGYVLGTFGLYEAIQQTIYIYIPLLTMNLMSREYASGSVKLIFSSPVSSTQIVGGKFVALMFCSLIFTAILALPMATVALSTPNMDWGLVASGLLAMFLLTMTYCSIGLFMSSLTAYQVVAAVMTFATLAFLNYIGTVGQESPLFREITHWLSINSRASELVGGLICSEDVIYFVAVSLLFLWWTRLRLDGMHERRSAWGATARYAGVLALVVAVGYVSSRPAMMCYCDATHGEQRTLSPGSREVMKQLRGPMKITTYVNILDGNYSTVSPQARKADQARFKQYLRYKPDLRMEYVYYCHIPESDTTYAARYPGMDRREIAAEVARALKLSPRLLRDEEELAAEIDLRKEHYGFVRVVEWNGRQARLRLYTDDPINPHPSEREISAALKTMLEVPARVGVLTGHGERSISRRGDRDYSVFATRREYRYSMINQGFELTEIDLGRENIPDDVDILLAADPRTPLSEAENRVLDEFIARGGNMMIMADAGHQDAVNPLLKRFGLRAAEGVLTQPSEIGLYGFTPARATQYAVDSMRSFYRSMAMRPGSAVTMPSAVAIEITDAAQYDPQPLLCTDSVAWRELQTTDFTTEPTMDERSGERCGTYITAVALRRKAYNGREQRIVVTGDADCFSNSELQIGNRTGIRSFNSSMISGSFLWLSHGRFPVSVIRPDIVDRDTLLTPMHMPYIKLTYLLLIPLVIAIAGAVVLLRRRRG